MNCPQCSSQDYTAIEINLAGENTVQFYSCRRCEAKWWQRAGDTIELDEVLTLATQRKDQPRPS